MSEETIDRWFLFLGEWAELYLREFRKIANARFTCETPFQEPYEHHDEITLVS